MTATITETVPRNVGDQVEVFYSGAWVPATISGECCRDHWYAEVPGGVTDCRFRVEHIRAPRGETAETVWQVGDWVAFDFQGQTVFGQIVSVPVDPPGLFEVASIGHGRLYPSTTEVTRPDPVEWARAYVAEGEAQDHNPAAVIEALTRFDEAQGRIDATADTKQQFLSNVQEVASRTANEEEWCEVADVGLRKLGLERLRDEPDIEDVDWTVDVTVSLEREIDEEEVAEWLASHFDIDDDEGVSGTPVTLTGTAEITVSGTFYEVEEGSCVCDSIDRSQIREQMPTWASNLPFDYNGVNCDNDN